MVVPVDAIRSIHNAFRKDMAQIDAAALEMARGNSSAGTVLKRLHFFNEVLDWHARGEEAGVFPALEKVAPDVAWAYERDHRGLDEAYNNMNRSYTDRDLLQTARASAAFRFHLNIHLAKEDAHLYRIFAERIPVTEQKKALGILSASVPQERFLEVVEWWMSMVGQTDRENIIRIWLMVLPPPFFAEVREVIQKVTGSDWIELTRRIPGL
jgi:hemerythrin-like domain-containing protein